MAANLAPGVYWNEIDLSQYIARIATTTLALVSTASKGEINKRTLVTDTGNLNRKFGPATGEHYGIYAGQEYLKEGNNLWFIRVESSTTPAETASATLSTIAANSVDIDALDPGTYYNDLKVETGHVNPKTKTLTTDGSTFVETTPSSEWTLTGTLIAPVVANSIKISRAGSDIVTDDGAGNLTGTGYTGTINYSTGAYSLVSTVDPELESFVVINSTYTGFYLRVVRERGYKRYTLEEYDNLNLDENNDNTYYVKQLSRSSLIKPPTLSEFPATQTATITGGSDGLTGITDSDYIGIDTGYIKTGLQQFTDPEDIDVNLLCIPGITTPAVAQALASVATTRADCIAAIDAPKGISITDAADWANAEGAYAGGNPLDTSYAAIYYNWPKILDPLTNEEKLVPPSGYVAAAFVRADRLSRSDAPAGPVSALNNVIGSEFILNQGDRNYLAQNRINPIASLRGAGLQIQGQMTSQIFPSSLDRVGARKVLIEIEKSIVTAMYPFLFKKATSRTWDAIRSIVQPYLDALVVAEDLIEGKIVIDSTTNTTDVIENNEIVANIFVKLPKYAERIRLNFVVVATGANIEEYIGEVF